MNNDYLKGMWSSNTSDVNTKEQSSMVMNMLIVIVFSSLRHVEELYANNWL